MANLSSAQYFRAHSTLLPSSSSLSPCYSQIQSSSISSLPKPLLTAKFSLQSQTLSHLNTACIQLDGQLCFFVSLSFHFIFLYWVVGVFWFIDYEFIFIHYYGQISNWVYKITFSFDELLD